LPNFYIWIKLIGTGHQMEGLSGKWLRINWRQIRKKGS
jgi:hypothetical protein